MNILITGSTGGIGKALMEFFKGENVIGLTRKDGDARSTQFISGVEEACKKLGTVDVLINCLATTKDGLITNMSVEDFDEVMDVNVNSVFMATKAVLPYLKGSIINIGSVVSKTGSIGCANYVASKAAIEGFTKTCAREGIRANCLMLGFFNVGLGERLPEKVKERVTKSIPLGRFGTIEEICHAVQFLATTTYMTGNTLELGGGL